jgi:hypothetical protein
MMKPMTRMLDLEEQLYADKDGTVKARLLADLSAMQLRLQGDMRKVIVLRTRNCKAPCRLSPARCR